MSMDRCHQCDELVDTDKYPDSYIRTGGQDWYCVCSNCRLQKNYIELIDLDTKATMFDYLEELRVSGATNMFGAAPYLAEEFDIEQEDAKQVVVEWVLTAKDKWRKN